MNVNYVNPQQNFSLEITTREITTSNFVTEAGMNTQAATDQFASNLMKQNLELRENLQRLLYEQSESKNYIKILEKDLTKSKNNFALKNAETDKKINKFVQGVLFDLNRINAELTMGQQWIANQKIIEQKREEAKARLQKELESLAEEMKILSNKYQQSTQTIKTLRENEEKLQDEIAELTVLAKKQGRRIEKLSGNG